jgi:hypothetical protein
VAKWLEAFRQSGKLPAFLIHLAISAALVASLAGVAYFIWYPPPYFQLDGGWHVMQLVLAVDLVLGPLLTLIVFRRGKTSLKFDLSAIAAVQLAGFIYGAMILIDYRPAFLVYAEKSFFAVPWRDVEQNTRDLPRVEAMRAARGPATVVLELPDDPALRQRLRAAMKAGGARITALGDYYQPMTPERWHAIAADGLDAQKLLGARPELKPDVARFQERFLEGSSADLQRLVFYLGVMRYGMVMFAMDRESGAIAGWMD